MIDSRALVTDAQLLGAWDGGTVKRDGIPHAIFAQALRPVAEFAIAAYINATVADKLEQLDRVTAAVERFTGELLT